MATPARAALGVAGMVLASLGGAEPAEPPRPQALQVPFQALWRAERSPLEIPVGDVPQSVRLALPTLPRQAGQVPCLRFAVRLHTPAPAGWNNYLAVRIHGRPVDALTSRRQPRLLNHRGCFTSTLPAHRKVSFFLPRAGLPCLNVFFMPHAQAVDESVTSERAEGGWYLLDVSDLLGDQAGSLELINTAVRAYWDGRPPEGLRLVMEGLEIGAVPDAQVQALRAAQKAVRAPVTGTRIANEHAELTAAATGGLSLRFAGETFFVESTFTALGARCELACLPQPTTEGAVTPTVRPVGANELAVHAERRAYSLSRTVTLRGHRVEVADTLTNRGEETLGIVVAHQVVTPDFPADHRLSGLRELVLGAGRVPENPTLFLAQKAAGLGVVAEDNALRLRLSSELDGNVARFGTEHFGLAPKASYTLRWTLYPTTTDYFDFLNALRRDWKANFTVQGPFEFVDARAHQKAEDAERLRALLERKRIKLFALTPWFEYYSSADLGRDEYKALVQSAMRVIKAARPDALCLACVETNLTPVPLAFFHGTLPADVPYGRPGHTYPIGRTPGQYGYPAPPDAAKVIAASPWHDCVIRDEHGRPLLDTWYVHNYSGKALNLMVYPHVGNYWHRQMMDKLSFLLDEVGVDGVYIDQFSLAYGDRDRTTHDRWDGHTVDMDPTTGKVTRQYAELGWVSAAARREWVEFILRKGKVVVANSMPAVSELQSLPIARFMETANYDPVTEGVPDAWVCAEGQLASPIGLGFMWGYDLPGATWAGKPKGAEFFLRTVVAHLRYGMLYYYYCTNVPAEGAGAGEYGPVNHMFPFTPEELHEGWVLGKERLITCVSGAFPWRKPRPPTVRLFDAHGREKPFGARIEPTPDGFRIHVSLQDWREVAVAE